MCGIGLEPHMVIVHNRVLKNIPNTTNDHLHSTPRDAKPLNLLHLLIRSKDVTNRMIILKQLTAYDSSPYSTILLRCATCSLIFEQEYCLMKYFANVIIPSDSNEKVRATLMSALLHSKPFLDAEGSLEFLHMMGPYRVSSALCSALQLALHTHAEITVALWDRDIVIEENRRIRFPSGMLLDLVRLAQKYTETDAKEPILFAISRVVRRFAANAAYSKEITETQHFPSLVISWLSLSAKKTLIDTAAEIIVATSSIYNWGRHKRVRKRLWELGAEGRGLAAVLKVVANETSELSLVLSVARHVNVDDVEVEESTILAAQVVKRMIHSLSIRVKVFPEALDTLAKLSSAKNRHVRFWGMQGILEQSQHSRFYLARSNLCLRVLLVAMKKDHCLQVRKAASDAICNICKDPVNAITLVRRSDVLPSLVSCVWNADDCLQTIESCESLVEALLAFVSNKSVDPDRLANTFRFIESLEKYGNHPNPAYDRNLQRVSLRSAALLEPFQQTRQSS